uniref:BZIP domain-containing protein n=1 Tax=Phaeomonas parva TaxID=124430 RepID=A0A7S1U2A0_9STRA|mmetsp:Transcript_28468/g.91150  ORF Transcript_28468/g.91150 Transcript_28468/m.91150 type:complete len:274 (+) Transcript_28468:362-1183(+)
MSRERNREHARRTRLRKKIRLQAMRERISGLQVEWHTLRQMVEDCRCASLLVQMSAPSGKMPADLSLVLDYQSDLFNESEADGSADGSASGDGPGSSGHASPDEIFEDVFAGQASAGQKRRRSDSGADGDLFRSELEEELGDSAALRSVLAGKKPRVSESYIEARKQLHGMTEQLRVRGEQLSTEEADSIRREKNRIHAKLTRERKKLYMSAMEDSIHQLDQEIKHMKEIIAAAHSAAQAGDTLPLPPFFPQFTVLHPFVPKNEVPSARLQVA